MKKRKLKETLYVPLLDDEERFEIYQITDSFSFNVKQKEFRPAPYASPAYGTRVDDKPVYVDNAGKVDVDMGYDYIRKDKDKHVTEDEIIAKYGTKYYEFEILNNEKAKEYLGGEAPELKEEPEPEKKSRPVKKFSIFEEDADTFIHEEDEKKPEVKEEDREFAIHLSVDEDDTQSYGSESKDMPKAKQTSIPSFLTEKPKEEEKKEPEYKFDSEEPVDFSFDDMPSMESPEIKFTDNPPIDRNISIEEAMERAAKGDYATVEQPAPDYSKPLDEVEDTSTVSAETEDEDIPDDVESMDENTESMEETPTPEKKKPHFIPEDADKYKNYHIDYESMFEKSGEASDEVPAWLEEKKQIINDTLIAFGIQGEVICYQKGPAFTLYEIMLSPGQSVKKVNQIRDNLAMSLMATSLRILCPIPGKNTVGIEVPNDVAEVVKFGDILSDSFVNGKKPLQVALGKRIDGTPVYEDITEMPHALIAGATKSGKSVCINTILISLLVKNSPERLKLILVDPKMVEMSFYNDIPHLAVPVITDLNLAGEALKWACEEMDRRYFVFSKNQVRNIDEYNKKRATYPELENMPYIVAVIDEFNDLVMQCGAEVSDSIKRLVQKARACGIHVLLATQRPTVQVVDGTIKANVTCRIAFRVASAIDSQTILDEIGAENLLGRGDMLIKNGGAPVRAQGAYMPDEEIIGICKYLTETYKPDYLFNLDDLKKRMNQAGQGASLGGKDVAQESEELLFEIAEYCVDSQSCSINSIQNRFNIGFNRASRIVTMLEDRNIVSPKNGKQSREILVDSYKLREMFGVDDN